jgi:hypothetical protein
MNLVVCIKDLVRLELPGTTESKPGFTIGNEMSYQTDLEIRETKLAPATSIYCSGPDKANSWFRGFVFKTGCNAGSRLFMNRHRQAGYAVVPSIGTGIGCNYVYSKIRKQGAFGFWEHRKTSAGVSPGLSGKITL